MNETQFIHTMSEYTQDELPPIIDEEQFQECQEFNTDHDLEPPEDDILEFITSQEHSDDQLDQVLQTYQAYQESQSDNEKPHTQINAHITYHVAQAQNSKHGSLVDREQMEDWQVQMLESLAHHLENVQLLVLITMKYQDWTWCSVLHW